MLFFQIAPDSKKPAVRWSDKTTWREGPPNEGEWHALPCGEDNGFFVVDLDIRAATDTAPARNGLTSLTEAFPDGLPDTRTVQTKHGWHLYYAYPEGGLRGRIAMLPGVDVKSQGGYVLGPGTPGYTLARDIPIAAAPPELLAMIRREGEEVPAESAVAIDASHPDWLVRLARASAFLAGEPPCVAGQGGDAQLLKVALRLARTFELPHETSLELLGAYNARCLPPWPREELFRKLAYAAEHGTGPTGCAPAGFDTLFSEKSAADPDTIVVQWPPAHNPEHAYSFDSGVELAGGDHASKMAAIQDRALGALFVGPSAPPAWCGVFRWDEFRERVYAFQPPVRLDCEGARGLSGRDLTEIRFWIACRLSQTVTAERLLPVIEAAAMQLKFNPICDYLDSLQKVPLDRARAWFAKSAATLWGGNDLESEMFKRQCIAAVRRVRQPGCKVDDMLILHGEQGYRKSSLLRKMFGEFFLDQFCADFANKDAADALRGKWGVEIPELSAAISKRDENARKGFLSREEDVYRAAYARTTEAHPRQCSVWGTTNDDDLLTDATGNRRYNIVHIQREIDVDAFDRDELWACANALESAGDTHFFTRAESKVLNAHREAYVATDPWDDGVMAYAEKCRASGQVFITAAEVLTKCILLPLVDQKQEHLNRVGRILRARLGERRSFREGVRIVKGHGLS